MATVISTSNKLPSSQAKIKDPAKRNKRTRANRKDRQMPLGKESYKEVHEWKGNINKAKKKGMAAAKRTPRGNNKRGK